MTVRINNDITLACTAIGAILALALIAPNSAMAAEEDAFNGPFIGVEAGWEGRKIDGTVPTTSATVTLQDSQDDFAYALIAGYDYRIGDIVVGAQAGFSPEGPAVNAPITGTGGTGGSLRIDPKWRLDLSARVGAVIAPRLLAYGRVGYTMERSRISGLVDAQTNPLAAETTTIDGVSFGGGLEYQLNSGLSVRAEYRRTQLDGALSSNRALAGITYRF